MEARGLVVTPNDRGARSAIDRRAIRHPGYRQSQRQLVEGVFGCVKTIGGVKLRDLGRAHNKLRFELTAAYILTRPSTSLRRRANPI